MENDVQEQDSIELESAEQVTVPFLNDLLLALQGVDGEVYIPVVPVAERLGIASPYSQIARIRRDETMAEALRRMPIETSGGTQKMQCLRVII